MNIFPTLPGLGINVKRSTLTSTAVQAATSGKELRASWWSYPKYQYTLTFNFLRNASFSAQTVFDEVQTLGNFFLSQGGQFSSFLFTDPIDNAVSAMGFGVGNGSTTAFQLQRCPVGQFTDVLGTWPVYTAPRTNNLLQSQTFSNASWTKQTGVVVTANAAVAPDGTPTASLIDLTSASVGQGILQAISTNYNNALNSKGVWMRGVLGGEVVTIKDPSLTVGTLTCTMTTSWQRFTLSESGQGAGGSGLWICKSSGNQIYAWGGQSEPGLPTDYIPTTTAAVTVTPSYWPTTGSAFEPIYYPQPGLAVYRQDWQGNQLMYQTSRTNLCAHSVFPSSWNQFLTTAGSAATAPDGSTTAVPVIPNATSGQHYVDNQSIIALTSGTIYTASAYVKANGYNYFVLSGDFSEGFLPIASFNLTTGTLDSLGTATAATITPVGNGWYRVTVTGPATGTFAYPGFGVNPGTGASFQTWAGNGTSGIYLWGFQVEVGSIPTSYIPTTTTAVTVTDYAVSNGLVTFSTAPLTGAVLTWSGSYWRQVRFAQDALDWEQIVNLVWGGGTVKLLSVK